MDLLYEIVCHRDIVFSSKSLVKSLHTFQELLDILLVFTYSLAFGINLGYLNSQTKLTSISFNACSRPPMADLRGGIGSAAACAIPRPTFVVEYTELSKGLNREVGLALFRLVMDNKVGSVECDMRKKDRIRIHPRRLVYIMIICGLEAYVRLHRTMLYRKGPSLFRVKC